MSSFAVPPAQAVPPAPSHQQHATPQRHGPAHAEPLPGDEGPQPLTFAVGAAGENLGSVRVVIKDEAGATVASFNLAALSGTQTVIWTPHPNAAAGAYSAYWEGDSDMPEG